jgi:hypothetical protein
MIVASMLPKRDAPVLIVRPDGSVIQGTADTAIRDGKVAITNVRPVP